MNPYDTLRTVNQATLENVMTDSASRKVAWLKHTIVVKSHNLAWGWVSTNIFYCVSPHVHNSCCLLAFFLSLGHSCNSSKCDKKDVNKAYCKQRTPFSFLQYFPNPYANVKTALATNHADIFQRLWFYCPITVRILTLGLRRQIKRNQ